MRDGTRTRVGEVRTAEARADGAAARGRADAAGARPGSPRPARDLLGGVYGARVVLLVGSGDNGGDALYAGARLARRGAGVSAVLLAPTGRTPAGWPRCVAAGGGVATTPSRCSAARDLVLDGIVGIGGSGGLRPGGAAALAGRRARRGRRSWSPSTCRAGSTPTPAR